MAMSIISNTLSLSAQRSLNSSQSSLSISLQRLSSGLRVNSAKDDAAGLAISDRMTSQIRGMNQAGRNVNDGVSLLQVAEGGLSEVTSLLQRGRELAVQAANATNSATDKDALQSEVNQLFAEIDRIGSDTAFNGIKIFSGGNEKATYADIDGAVNNFSDKDSVISNLQRSWLEQSEKVITEYFGIQANDTDLKIILEDSIDGNATAYVAATFSGGQLGELTLNIDMEELSAIGLEWPSTLDQLIAHEMTHAVMDATTNVLSFEKWFMEGTAELIPGGDDRLNFVKNTTSDAALVANIDNLRSTTEWDVTNLNYATAYTATRYMHDVIGGEGVKEALQYLAADKTRTMDDYFSQANVDVEGRAIESTDDFISAFKGIDHATDPDKDYSGITNNGEAFLGNMDLDNNDTGAIGGADADGGSRITTNEGTIPDIDSITLDPLVGFNEEWPDFVENRRVLLENSGDFQLHVGADANMTIDLNLKVLSVGDLGLSDVDISEDPTLALTRFDVALNAIDTSRGEYGAVMNRLDSVSNYLQVSTENISAARGRIQDTDFASETANMTKNQILQQAGTAMLAQANQIPQAVLSLLG